MWRVYVAVAMVGTALVWLVGAWALDRYGLRPVPNDGFDLIIVAGCKVRPDGSPSLALRRRTAHAVSLWEQGRAPAVVFTGGVGDHGASEASVAAAWARGLGLPAEVIRLEERSTSTDENARYAAVLYPAQTVLVVSDSYHIFRAERVFGRYYPRVVGAGSAPTLPFRLKGSLREVPALAWYGLTGRL